MNADHMEGQAIVTLNKENPLRAESESSDATGNAVATPDAQRDLGNANVGVSTPEFPVATDSGAVHANPSIHRFRDIRVPVTAELGRVTLPIGDLLKLGEGSVIELDRSVNSYIDLMSQGVRIARGEVVVVDDCFAVRIKEIDTPKENGD